MSESHLTEVWNLLHDGNIESIDRPRDGSLVFGVSIEYLTERMKPSADMIRVRLFEWKDAECARFINGNEADNVVCEIDDLKGSGILSADVTEAPFTIWFDDAKLTISYTKVTLDAGPDREMTIEDLAKLAKEYWDAFSKD